MSFMRQLQDELADFKKEGVYRPRASGWKGAVRS